MSFRLSLLFTLLVFIGLPVLGQGTSLIKTADGILWVENREDIHFVIELKGSEVKPMERYPFMSVDGRPTQIALVGINKFYKAPGDARANDLTILQAHRDWEADHHGKLLSSKPDVKSEPINTDQNRAALIWSYAMPEEKDRQVKEQWFLTTILGDQLLLLNTTLFDGDPATSARNLLINTLSTLQISAKPIDVKAMSESIRKTGKISLPDK